MRLVIDPTADGNHVSEVRANTAWAHSIGLKSTRTSDECVHFHSRVHSVYVPQSESEGTVLLRQDGQFIKAFLHTDSINDNGIMTAQHLTAESLVQVSGKFLSGEVGNKEDESDAEVLRLQVYELTVLSAARDDIPENIVLHGAPGDPAPVPSFCTDSLDRRLDNRLLDARVASTGAIFKLFSGVHELAVAHLASLDFYHTPTPSLVDYEFPGEEDDYFRIPYFEKTAGLVPTGEVHLGMALSADLQRVYDCHTVFRREAAVDSRHLTEFTMLEMVMALQHDWTEILDLADDVLITLIRSLQGREKYSALTKVAQRVYPLAATFNLGLDEHDKLIKIKFSKAKAILREVLGYNTKDEDDLSREEEAALGWFMASKSSGLGPATDIFIITHFPMHLRGFNVYPSGDGDSTSRSFDVIMRGQEIVTGCQILHSHEELRSRMTGREHPIDPDSPGWRPFVMAHDIGMPPWGGFGLGLNRFVQGYLGLTDIRETVLFPRNATRLTP